MLPPREPTPKAPPHPMKRLELMDWLRLIAALFVMSFHYFVNGIANHKISSLEGFSAAAGIAQYGYLGVEFFFMISGYVILMSAQEKTARQFAVSRLLRLYPAFWAAVLLTSALAFFWGAGTTAVTLPQFAINLTMFSPAFGVEFVDEAYWSLLFELRFYFLVLCFLLFGMQKRLAPLFIAWPALIALATLSGLNHLPYMDGYYSYFAAGACFFLLRERPRPLPLLSVFLSLALCLHFSLEKLRTGAGAIGLPYSETVVLIAVGAFFLFFFLLNTPSVSKLKLKGSQLAGALSYPVYLIHAHCGYMILSRFASEENKVFVYPLTILLILLAAWCLHFFIEKKCARLWRALLEKTAGKLVERMEQGMGKLRQGFSKFT